MARHWKLWLFAALLCAPIAHASKLYKWVDKDGKVSYHDRPPATEGYQVEEKSLRGRSAAAPSDEVVQKYPVVLYTAPKCGDCNSARLYLKDRGIPFTEKNVDGNRQLQDELIKQTGGLAVPTITVGGKVMRGYLESLLEGELDQAGYPKKQSADQAADESKEESKQDEQPSS